MGELVAGRPTFQLRSKVSLPLDLVSVSSLLYRAVPGSGLDPWLVQTRRSLPPEVVEDLDLLHGFSGRLLYYMEEPMMRLDPLRGANASGEFEELVEELERMPPFAFREMAVHALQRVHRDLGSGQVPPPNDDPAAWRNYILPALTTASPDAALELLADADDLKRRTIGLYRAIWEQAYESDFTTNRPQLEETALLARTVTAGGFGPAFSELTGNRLPSTLAAGLNEVESVTFVPVMHLGSFVSYIAYPPDLVVFFGAPQFLDRYRRGAVELPEPSPAEAIEPRETGSGQALIPLASEPLLEAMRALSDLNRLRILDLLMERELYAQEIVGRLGIAQSAVSRHLSLLERAHLIRVRPHGGMKYYAVDSETLALVGDALRGGR